ncbi:hypothetical protein Taro_043558 [Colocasia esculenta]|uniref:Uncharacterized protein n=1 Tax=Colocasia esculenta TaxID=4460 RepID=A0A843X499_COLES|nr:hypothetical protein [Colocasia esculenta]
MVCSFWRWSKIWKTPFAVKKLLLEMSKCVDTQADCVDTTGYCIRTGFWEGHRSVSTHRQTVSTPLAIASELASGRDSKCRHTGRLC